MPLARTTLPRLPKATTTIWLQRSSLLCKKEEMFEKIKSINAHTRWFIFQWAVYFILMLLTTLYVYARLEFVRTKPLEENVKSKT